MRAVSLVIAVSFLTSCTSVIIKSLESQHNHTQKNQKKFIKKMEACLVNEGYELSSTKSDLLDTKPLDIKSVGQIRVRNRLTIFPSQKSYKIKSSYLCLFGDLTVSYTKNTRWQQCKYFDGGMKTLVEEIDSHKSDVVKKITSCVSS